MEEEGSCLLQSDLMENLEISMTLAHEQGMPVKTQSRTIQRVTWEHCAVPSRGLSLPVEHILYVPECPYVCVYVHAICHKGEMYFSVPEA